MEWCCRRALGRAFMKFLVRCRCSCSRILLCLGFLWSGFRRLSNFKQTKARSIYGLIYCQIDIWRTPSVSNHSQPSITDWLTSLVQGYSSSPGGILGINKLYVLIKSIDRKIAAASLLSRVIFVYVPVGRQLLLSFRSIQTCLCIVPSSSAL